MDESGHSNKPVPESPTPDVDQLLRLLEMEAAARRRPRGALPPALQGGAFRYGSLVVIVIFALGSIAVMEWVVSQLPRPAAAPFSEMRGGSGNPGNPAAEMGKDRDAKE